MKAQTLIPLLIFGMILIANFYYWSRVARWYALRKAFPLGDAAVLDQNLQLQYGNANVCGHYMRNAVFSGTTKAGIIIKKAFPYSFLMPPIFIPWSGIERLCKVVNVEGATGLKLSRDVTDTEYVRIELRSSRDFVIVIPWNPVYADNIPQELVPAVA